MCYGMNYLNKEENEDRANKHCCYAGNQSSLDNIIMALSAINVQNTLFDIMQLLHAMKTQKI